MFSTHIMSIIRNISISAAETHKHQRGYIKTGLSSQSASCPSHFMGPNVVPDPVLQRTCNPQLLGTSQRSDLNVIYFVNGMLAAADQTRPDRCCRWKLALGENRKTSAEGKLLWILWKSPRRGFEGNIRSSRVRMESESTFYISAAFPLLSDLYSFYRHYVSHYININLTIPSSGWGPKLISVGS